MKRHYVRAAGAIAEKTGADERLFGASRGAAARGLRRELVAVMPTPSEWILADACNRYLATMSDRGLSAPQVERVSTIDGSVTLRAGTRS
jgi:hypothetical protein